MSLIFTSEDPFPCFLTCSTALWTDIWPKWNHGDMLEQAFSLGSFRFEEYRANRFEQKP